LIKKYQAVPYTRLWEEHLQWLAEKKEMIVARIPIMSETELEENAQYNDRLMQLFEQIF
jgi:hypothetical protein